MMCYISYDIMSCNGEAHMKSDRGSIYSGGIGPESDHAVPKARSPFYRWRHGRGRTARQCPPAPLHLMGSAHHLPHDAMESDIPATDTPAHETFPTPTGYGQGHGMQRAREHAARPFWRDPKHIEFAREIEAGWHDDRAEVRDALHQTTGQAIEQENIGARKASRLDLVIILTLTITLCIALIRFRA